MTGRWLVALYPARWRSRYGEEFEALLDEEPVSPSLVIDVIRGALAAHATAPPDLATTPPNGAIPMRTRVPPALVSLLALFLVLPGVTLLTTALVRNLQPPGQEPGDVALAVFNAFAAMSPAAFWLVLVPLPLLGLALAAVVAWRRLRDDPAARADVAAFADGLRRILHQPALVVAALAFLASVGVLLFAIGHAIAG
jgi:hypothetical protein